MRDEGCGMKDEILHPRGRARAAADRDLRGHRQDPDQFKTFGCREHRARGLIRDLTVWLTHEPVPSDPGARPDESRRLVPRTGCRSGFARFTASARHADRPRIGERWRRGRPLAWERLRARSPVPSSAVVALGPGSATRAGCSMRDFAAISHSVLTSETAHRADVVPSNRTRGRGPNEHQPDHR